MCPRALVRRVESKASNIFIGHSAAVRKRSSYGYRQEEGAGSAQNALPALQRQTYFDATLLAAFLISAATASGCET